jgi:hypothetical protein
VPVATASAVKPTHQGRRPATRWAGARSAIGPPTQGRVGVRVRAAAACATRILPKGGAGDASGHGAARRPAPAGRGRGTSVAAATWADASVRAPVARPLAVTVAGPPNRPEARVTSRGRCVEPRPQPPSSARTGRPAFLVCLLLARPRVRRGALSPHLTQAEHGTSSRH